MFIVKRLPEFDEWLKGLRDDLTQKRLIARLRKAQLGNLGDVKAVGESVFEMREFFGPGWRMYFARRGDVLIVMLGGGDKSTQAADIKVALERAKRLVE
jgi:putative addiction module killer protein